jgi:cyclopropane fatty-acyl-phospholipid synthase-like methyltransferase
MNPPESSFLRSAPRVVAAGYDALGTAYLEWADQIRGDPRLGWLDDLMDWLPAGARVLELGCGAGIPCTQRLVERFSVTGVDISQEQLRLARRFVPRGMFVRANMADAAFRTASFDAVTAFYSVIHVPRQQHAQLFGDIRRWLRPGGFLLASLTAGDTPDLVEDGFVGVPMFFSGFEPAVNRTLSTEVGLTVIREDVVTMHEPEGDASFHWVLASAPR